MATATLMVDKANSRIVTPEELTVLPPPTPRGRWHRPLAHGDVVTALHAEADQRGLEIVREQWALTNRDERLFGVMEFDTTKRIDGIENRWSIGIRNSVDQSLALRGVAGTTTLVCDNLLLQGKSFILARKNTLHARLAEIVKAGFERYLLEQTNLDAVWARLVGESLTDDAAKALILDAFVKHEVAAIKYLPPVAEEYFDPESHPDTEPRTKAGLLGAFTRAFKKITSHPVRWGATQKVAEVFGA
jgi:hypothetical protein